MYGLDKEENGLVCMTTPKKKDSLVVDQQLGQIDKMVDKVA